MTAVVSGRELEAWAVVLDSDHDADALDAVKRLRQTVNDAGVQLGRVWRRLPTGPAGDVVRSEVGRAVVATGRANDELVAVVRAFERHERGGW